MNRMMILIVFAAAIIMLGITANAQDEIRWEVQASQVHIFV